MVLNLLLNFKCLFCLHQRVSIKLVLKNSAAVNKAATKAKNKALTKKIQFNLIRVLHYACLIGISRNRFIFVAFVACLHRSVARCSIIFRLIQHLQEVISIICYIMQRSFECWIMRLHNMISVWDLHWNMLKFYTF